MSAPASPAVRVRYRLSALAVAATCLLSACSGHSEPSAAGPSGGVASIGRTSPAGAPPTTTAVPVEGPLIRADTTEDEITRLTRAYNTCLKNQGVPIVNKDKGISSDADTTKRYTKEITACASKHPETVPDREERKSPGAFQDHLHEQVTCMKAKGLDVILIPPDGWGVTDEAAARGYIPDFKVVNKCQVEAFGS